MTGPSIDGESAAVHAAPLGMEAGTRETTPRHEHIERAFRPKATVVTGGERDGADRG
jgi:hypothetical protein